MPNWCDNRVTLKHAEPAMMKRAVDAFERSQLLNEFIPIPADLVATQHGSVGDADEKLAHIEKQESNIQKYGYADWYNFCTAEWGTKWDIGGGDYELDGDTLTIWFESAWSPPIEAYEKLAGMGFEISAYYYEGGCAFCGLFVGNEEYTNNNEYGIDGNSDWVVKNIPKDIDQMFGISEGMADYESELSMDGGE